MRTLDHFETLGRSHDLHDGPDEPDVTKSEEEEEDPFADSPSNRAAQRRKGGKR